jgi:serine/threonine protein kinase
MIVFKKLVYSKFVFFTKKIQKKLFQSNLKIQSLDHPNIIRYVEGFIEGKELIIVLELADAGDLGRMIKHFKSLNKKIPEKTIW